MDQPGVYSWWADDDGLAVLSAPFGVRLPRLIYAGQTGATSTRTRTERVSTLRDRIGGNHLNGNVRSSTFRKTLSAALAGPLGLRLARPNRLDPASNAVVSAWMRTHLQVVAVPYPDRGTLAAVEHALLMRLDPPLNLMGMADTPIRRELRRLRQLLGAPAAATT